MSNLLPQEEKKTLTKEYRLRKAVVSLFLFAALLVSAIVLLIPAYILASRNAGIATAGAEKVKKEIAAKETVNSDLVINDTNKALGELAKDIKAETTLPAASDVFAGVLAHKTSNITLSNLFYSRGGKSSSLSVKGVAKDRTTLDAFVRDLKSESMFASVNLPVAALVQEKDINFSLTIQVQTPSTSKK